MKQQQEPYTTSQEPSPNIVSFAERIDLILVQGLEQVIEYLTRHLPMDLEAFFEYFQWNFAIAKTQKTITLAQFIEVYIEYIEQT